MKVLRIGMVLIGLSITSVSLAETPAFIHHRSTWCQGVTLIEVGKNVKLRYCFQHEGHNDGPLCRHINFCNPDFGTEYVDEFIFNRESEKRVTVKIRPQAGPTFAEVSCCSIKSGEYVDEMSVRPSVSRAYDSTVNTEDEICKSFFGKNWYQCYPYNND